MEQRAQRGSSAGQRDRPLRELDPDPLRRAAAVLLEQHRCCATPTASVGRPGVGGRGHHRPPARRARARAAGLPRPADRAARTGSCSSEHLDVALARAQRAGRGVAVLYVDLDDFKLVNDSFGHNAGDELLCEVATRLQDATRAADVVARQGGDEFLILIADVDVGDERRVVDIADVARRVAEQVRAALQRPLMLADTEIYTSASLGHQPLPGRRPRRREPAQARRHRDVQGQGVGPRRLPAVLVQRPRPARAAVDGRPPAPGESSATS